MPKLQAIVDLVASHIFGRKRNPHLGLVVAFLVGVLLLLSAFHLLSWKNVQVDIFNEGLEAYQAADKQHAIELFDHSLAVYRGRLTHETWLQALIYPPPDCVVAARAAFQKAKALFELKQPEAALEAFKESLLLNPGNGFDSITLSEAQIREREARYSQYDLELLFAGNPELAKQEGDSKQQGEPANKPSPDNEPGQQSGQGDPNSI